MKNSEYLAYQLSGPIAQTLIKQCEATFNSYEELVSFWTTLSLDTAYGAYLDFIGTVLGIPRPVVMNTSFFRFSPSDTPTEDSELGFSSVMDRETGGVLDSVFPVETGGVKVSDWTYRRYLRSCAPLRKTLSLANLDLVVYTITEGASCTITFDIYGDVHIELSHSVTYAVLDLVQQIVDRFFVTEPRIFVTRAL